MFLPSLSKAAGAAGAAQGRVIEWAAPAPGWLLALSSGAFFLLAFFAFSQYRRRVTCALSSGEEENEGAALSTCSHGSSGTAPASLPAASARGLLASFFPALSYRLTETFVGAVPHVARPTTAELPPPHVGLCFANRRVNTCNRISAFRTFPATSAASSSVVATAAATGPSSAAEEALDNIRGLSPASATPAVAAGAAPPRRPAAAGPAAAGETAAAVSAAPPALAASGETLPALAACATGLASAAGAAFATGVVSAVGVVSAASVIPTTGAASAVGVFGAAGAVSAAAAAPSAGKGDADAASDTFSEVSAAAAAPSDSPASAVNAHGFTSGAALTATLEALSASAAPIAAPALSTSCSNVMPLRSVSAAAPVAEAAASGFPRRAGDFDACHNLEDELRATAAAAPREAAEEDNKGAPYLFVYNRSVYPADSDPQNPALQEVACGTRNGTSAGAQRDAATAAACVSAATPSKCGGSITWEDAACSAAAGSACNVPAAADNTSAVTCAPAAAHRAAAFCKSPMTCSFLGSPRDFCASSPQYLLRAREVVLHGAAPPMREKRPHSRGRILAAAPFGSPNRRVKATYDAPAKGRRQRTPPEVSAAAEFGRRAGTAVGVRCGPARGRRQRAAGDGAEPPTSAEPRDAPGGVEELDYYLLAVDEEDSPAAACGARPAFVFEGASMRSWILAIVAVAALLRALLLLLQLVANPLEGARAPPPPAAAAGSVPSSLVAESSIPWYGAADEEMHASAEKHDAAVAVSSRRLSVSGRHANPDSVAVFLPPSESSDAPSKSLFPAAGRSVNLLLPAAASSLRLLSAAGGDFVAPVSPSKGQSGDARTLPSSPVQLPFPPNAVVNAPSSPRLPFRFARGAEKAAVFASPESLFLAGTSVPSTTSLPASESSVSSQKPALHAGSLPSWGLSPALAAAAETRRTETETAALPKATLPARLNTRLVFRSRAATDNAGYVQTQPDYGTAVLRAAGEATAAAHTDAAAPADAAASVSGKLERHGNAHKVAYRNAVQSEARNVRQGVPHAAGSAVERDGSLSSSNTPCNSRALSSSNTDDTGNVSFNSSSVASLKGYSGTSGEPRSTSAAILASKGRHPTTLRHSGSSRKDGRSREAPETQNASKNSDTSKISAHSMWTRRKRIVHGSNASITPPRSGRGGEGRSSTGRGRAGWPSGLWLRTLARSLPSMLCLEAYALLILFLMDLFYASSRLENVKWIAVGSYIFLGGVWLLFVSIAGLTVGEESTRREAAHLFARSVCCLLGFCFTLLSVSLAVVGTLLLQQLRGRACAHLFFPPCMMLHHPIFETSSSLHAAVASEVYRPSRAGPHFAAAFFRGGNAAFRPLAAWNRRSHRRGYTGREHSHSHRSRTAAAGGNRSCTPAYLGRYWSTNPPGTPVAAAALLEERVDQFNDTGAETQQPPLYCKDQQRKSTQRECPVGGSAWEEQRQQGLLEHDVCDPTQTSRKATYAAPCRSLLLLPLNLFNLTCFRGTENVEASPGGNLFDPVYSTAWRRLFMLTLCCPPLLLMRGVHLLLVGLQVFSHYYPVFVEEKGTFDVLMYLVTEWLPLTLLVCALSKTVPSRRHSSSTVTDTTWVEDGHHTSLCAVHSACHPVIPCRNDCRDSSATSEWSRRSRSKGNASSAVTPCAHRLYCPLATHNYTAAFCAREVQPQDLEQPTGQWQQHDVEEEEAVNEKPHKSLCGTKNQHQGICTGALRTVEHASHRLPESCTGLYASKMNKWKQLLYCSSKGKAHLPKESPSKDKSYGEHFRIPLLADEVLSGSQALRLAQQQHGSSTSSSNSSRETTVDRQVAHNTFEPLADNSTTAIIC